MVGFIHYKYWFVICIYNYINHISEEVAFLKTHKFSKNSCNLNWMNDEGFTAAPFLTIMSFKCQLYQPGIKQKQNKKVIFYYIDEIVLPKQVY